MARLIDADALLDEFLKRYTERERNGNLVFAACEIKQDFADMISDFQYTSGFDEAVTRVENFPSADVAPVRHGRWKCNKPCPVCGEDRFKGLDADIWADWEPLYCPNCGAKMDEVIE